jgi:hypothetical protein
MFGVERSMMTLRLLSLFVLCVMYAGVEARREAGFGGALRELSLARELRTGEIQVDP